MIARYAAPALIALMMLGACQKKAPDAPASPATQTGLAPSAGLAISEGRLVLPAVAGNPAAAYFKVANNSDAAASITGIAITGAKQAEMHVTSGGSMEPLPKLDLAAGESVTFAEGGKHVMVFGLADSVKVGSVTGITLTTADGRKITGQLSAQSVGGAMDHAHMKM